MSRTKQIPGVISVRLEALDDLLFVRYDPSVTDERRVSTAVMAAIDSIGR